MKKLLCCFLAVSLLLCAFSPALAGGTNEITINTSLDAVTDGLTVYGTIDTTEANVPLLVQLSKDGTVVNAAQTIATEVDTETGMLTYEFAPMLFALDAESGIYDIYVSGHFLDTYQTSTFDYVGADLKFAGMKAVSDAIESGSNTALETAIKEHGVSLGADTDSFLALGADGKSVFYRLMLQESYDIPEDYQTSEQKAQINKEKSRFIEAFNNAVAIGSFNDIATEEQLSNWFSKYFDAYHLGEADAEDTIPVNDMKPYFDAQKDTTYFLKKITGSPIVDTIKAIKERIYESALLATIEGDLVFKTREVMVKFPTQFPVNQANLNRITSDNEKAAVYAQIANTPYNSYGEVVKAFDDAVTQKINQSNQGNQGNQGGNQGGSWGTGGNSGTGSNTGGGNVTLPDPDTSTNKPKFTDLGSVSWAEEAIEHLYENGVISGRSDSVFAPNDPITRAEFVKIVLLAMDIPVDTNVTSTFNDVANGDWFCPYVMAAQKNQIVLGDDQNNFNPNAQITRQDMAVLLMRAAKSDAVSEYGLLFDDKAEVSDYAANAVAVLYEKGVINGLGGNLFGPGQTATRAQAAQMVYKMITSSMV